MENLRLTYLFQRYTTGTITGQEELELAQLVLDTDNNAQLEMLEKEHWNSLSNIADPLPAGAATSLTTILKQPKVQKPKQVPVRQITKWLAAASILIAATVATYFILFNKKNVPAIVQAPVINDVPAPDKSKASITLANGTVVYLDSVGNGRLAQQGNIQLVKLANGQIAYRQANGEIVKELQYNTLSNPRGSKVIDMQLADGSHVWLNAGSSITYPVAFVAGERKVALKGEGYFEVAKDAAKKFIVTANGTTTEVLGTHFNVNGYEGGADTKITLLEGSVKVRSHSGLDPESSGKQSNPVLLKPGQQAVVIPGTAPESLRVNSTVNTDEVMAWKNGLFNLNHVSFNEVMRQVSDWYNVEVVYLSKVPQVELYGEVSRQLNLSQIIQGLQTLGINCRLDGGKLLIK